MELNQKWKSIHKNILEMFIAWGPTGFPYWGIISILFRPPWPTQAPAHPSQVHAQSKQVRPTVEHVLIVLELPTKQSNISVTSMCMQQSYLSTSFLCQLWISLSDIQHFPEQSPETMDLTFFTNTLKHIADIAAMLWDCSEAERKHTPCLSPEHCVSICAELSGWPDVSEARAKSRHTGVSFSF